MSVEEVKNETLDAEKFESNEEAAEETDASTEESGQEESSVETYIPSLEYTVLGEKRKFADELSPLIKDEATEKRIRELYEKADGLEIYKQKLSRREQEIAERERREAENLQAAEEIDFLKKHNPREFLKRLGLDYQRLTLEDLEAEEKPEEVRGIYQENGELKRRIAELERFNERREREQREYDRSSQRERLQKALEERPEVKQLQDMGIEDFVEQVIDHGRRKIQAGVNYTYKQAVDDIINRYSRFIKPQEQAATTQAAEPVRQAPKRVIPSTGVSEGTSASRVVKTTDDLRRLYKARISGG